MRLCLHILPGASLHRDTRLLVGLANMTLEGTRFLLNVLKHAGSSQSIAGPETFLILKDHFSLSFRPRNPAKPAYRGFFLFFSKTGVRTYMPQVVSKERKEVKHPETFIIDSLGTSAQDSCESGIFIIRKSFF